MKKLIYNISLLILPLLFYSCVRDCTYQSPDIAKFNKNVSSTALQEKLKNDTIAIGMPHYILSEIFNKCDCEINIPVSETGFKVRAAEYEGLGREYENPNARIYLDIYKTPAGKLYIWYGSLDFYGLGVMKNDIILFYDSTEADTAKILYLTKPLKLRINKKLYYDTVHYAEIFHKEFNGLISSWYNLTVDDSNVLLNTPGKDFYPIYRMELNDKIINFFNIKNFKK